MAEVARFSLLEARGLLGVRVLAVAPLDPEGGRSDRPPERQPYVADGMAGVVCAVSQRTDLQDDEYDARVRWDARRELASGDLSDFFFSRIRPATLAERLVLLEVPTVRAICPECGDRPDADLPVWCCPVCRSPLHPHCVADHLDRPCRPEGGAA